MRLMPWLFWSGFRLGRATPRRGWLTTRRLAFVSSSADGLKVVVKTGRALVMGVLAEVGDRGADFARSHLLGLKKSVDLMTGPAGGSRVMALHW